MAQTQRVHGTAAHLARGLGITAAVLVGWWWAIGAEPRGWTAVLSEKDAWMGALGLSFYCGLVTGSFLWLDQALTIDARRILSEYGVEAEPVPVRRPYSWLQVTVYAAMGLLFSVSTIFWDPLQTAVRQEAGLASVYLLYLYAMNAVVWSIAFAAVGAEVHRIRSLGALLRRSVRPNLLEPVSSGALLRRGYRMALTCFGLVGSFSLLWLSGTANPMGSALISLAAVSMVAADFLHPALVLRSLTREVKQQELAAVAVEIRAEREASAAPGRQEDPRLANRIAYREMIAATREWPLEVSGFVRVATAILLGLTSWLGAAMVERFLDRVF